MAECQQEEAAELVEATNEAINVEGEPSNAELREMLVDIQINTATILRENKSIRSEMPDLKRTIQHQADVITALKSSLEHITKQYNEAERELVAARKKIQEQEEEIGELYDLQDKLEQYTRKNSLEIHGVPESAYTETEYVVLKLAEALYVSVERTISYPESSGFLVSGATPGRLWGHRILLPQDFCGKTMETVTEQPIKKIEFFRCPQSLPGVAPLTKKPEDSGYEIVEPKDIEICHKLNRKGNKPIIVKFISHKVKKICTGLGLD